MPYKFDRSRSTQKEKDLVDMKSAVNRQSRKATGYYSGQVERADEKAEFALELAGRLFEVLADKKDLLTEEEWSYIITGYDEDKVEWVEEPEECGPNHV